jgi:hypothetical protein
MADNKKSVLLYCDIIHTVKPLSDEEAGKLFKHYLMYINDENPEPCDRLTGLLFEPIKQNLKRDLKKWEATIESKSDAGNLGNLKRWNPDLHTQVINNELDINEALKIAQRRYAIKKSQTVAKVAVKDTVTDTVKVKDKVIVKDNIEQRKLKFASTLEPFLTIYGRELLNDFYRYWTQPNKSQTKFKQELEKTWSLDLRLQTWSKNDKKFKPPENTGKLEKVLSINEQLTEQIKKRYESTNDNR